MKNDIRTYLAQHSNAKLVSEVVRGSLGRTFAAKLLALVAVLTVATTVFFVASPTAGFIALAVGLFLL